jgi:beta-lactam-binding protein with PASTA domain
VGLVVSRGRPPAIGATVPNAVGKSQKNATTAVSKAGLTSQVFTVPSASVKSGNVVGQLPPPGSFVAKQSQVYLFVSRGTVSSTTTLTASVPNLIGQTQIQAITNINSAGLIAVVAQAYSSAIPPGIVYAQVPQPGAVVSRETQVGIIVSQGPAPQQ